MNKEVILSPEAEKDYEAVSDYLFNKFGLAVMLSFMERFEQIGELISTSPEIYPFINQQKQIRKCVVTKHNVIYYKNLKTLSV